MTRKDFDIIAIGGSAGSIPVLTRMLEALPEVFSVAVVIVVHRMKNVDSGLARMLSATKKITEPEDKERVKPGCIYLAPQNYHLLVEEDKTFSMDYAEPVHYCRPSIDVTFMSVSSVYKEKTLGFLLSGANRDGAEGLSDIIERGGIGIAQRPDLAEAPAMPEAALKMNTNAKAYSPEKIYTTLFELF